MNFDLGFGLGLLLGVLMCIGIILIYPEDIEVSCEKGVDNVVE